MLTYGCRGVTQDNAAVSGGGGGGFGPPASETNESQPQNMQTIREQTRERQRCSDKS